MLLSAWSACSKLWVQWLGQFKTKQTNNKQITRQKHLKTSRDSSRVLAGLHILGCSSLQMRPFYSDGAIWFGKCQHLQEIACVRRAAPGLIFSRSGCVMPLISFCICKMSICASLISIAVIQTTMTKNLGRKVGLASMCQLQAILERTRVEDQGKHCCRPWMDTTYWLASHGLLGLLPYTTQDLLPMGSTTHSDLSPLVSIITQENIHRTCLQANLMVLF